MPLLQPFEQLRIEHIMRLFLHAKFFKAKNYLSPKNNEEDHEDVAETLKRSDVLGNVGNNENRLRRSRNGLTYDISEFQMPNTNARSLMWMVSTAQDLIERVRNLQIR